jgi:hypothetical protein
MECAHAPLLGLDAQDELDRTEVPELGEADAEAQRRRLERMPPR